MSQDDPNIIRHTEKDREFEPAIGDDSLIEALTDHFERHIGEVDKVLHEAVSDLVHIDVHIIKATPDRPFVTLFTTGMAQKPMAAPEGAESCTHAELMMMLPGDWPIETDTTRVVGDGPLWPMLALQLLARFPHQFETWFWEGHTLPNGDPPEPLDDDTRLCCWMLTIPPINREDFATVNMSDGRQIHIFNVVGLYPEEVDLKLKKGSAAIYKGFSRIGYTGSLELDRPSVVRRKRFGMF